MTPGTPQTTRTAFAGVSFLTVFLWYALPDVVRSRRLRAVVKSALLGVTAAGVAQIPTVFPVAGELRKTERLPLAAPALGAVALGAASLLVGVTVWAERAIFARGERRRARGVRYPHTRAALGLALATATSTLVDWPRLARARSRS